jgi:Predicted metal-dependent membrane protease
MNDPQPAAGTMPASGENPYASPAMSADLVAGVALPASPGKPRIWTVFVALGVMLFAFVAVNIVGGIGLVVWYFAQGGSRDRLQSDLLEFAVQPGPFLMLGLLGQLAIGGVAITAASFSPVPLAERLGLVKSRWTYSTTAVAILGSIVPFAVGLAGAFALTKVLDPDPSVEKMYAAMRPAWALPFLLFISLCPGFFEEMMFRGYVQRRLLERWSPGIAILFTSLVFAAVHLAPHAVLFALPLGIWLGILAWKSGSTWPGIICHALINGLWNVWQLGARFEIFPEDPPLALVVGVGAVGVFAFGAALWLMFRPAPVTELN